MGGSEQEQCRVTVTDPMGVCGSGGTTTTVSSVSPTTLPDTTQPTCVTALKCAGDPIVLAMPSSGAIVLSAPMLLGTSETCGQNVMFSPPMLTCGDGGVQEVEVFVGSEQEQCRVTVTDPMGVCGSGGTTTTTPSSQNTGTLTTTGAIYPFTDGIDLTTSPCSALHQECDPHVEGSCCSGSRCARHTQGSTCNGSDSSERIITERFLCIPTRSR